MNTENDLSQYKIITPPDGATPWRPVCVRDPEGNIIHGYRYPHPAFAATVVVRDLSRNAFLVCRRGQDPYRGRLCFPGGFIEVDRETIDVTAAREVSEETGVEVAPENLQLIDVRSEPDRDPREHVIDVGYYVEIDTAEAKALDETDEVHWLTAKELDNTDLAFDQNILWQRAKRFIRD